MMFTKREWYFVFKNEEGEVAMFKTSPYTAVRKRELDKLIEKWTPYGFTFLREECEVVKEVR